MDLKDILATLKGRRSTGGILSEGAPQRKRRIEPTLVRNHLPPLLRLVSESWTRPAGSLSASGFDIIVMDAERAFRKSVEDFGAEEWRAVAMFLGSVIDNPSKRRGRRRNLDWKPFGEGLVYQKPRGAPPVEYDKADCRAIVQEIEVVKSEMPGRPTDKAAIKEFFKRRAASGGRRLSAYAVAEAKLARRLPVWRRQIRKIDEKSR